MKKVIVIGCPGSGKSTFSRSLHKKTGIPLHYLDMMYWNADKTTVEKSVFRERLAAVLATDAWIIDGNYGSTMELLEKYNYKNVIVFKSREQANAFLDGVTSL